MNMQESIRVIKIGWDPKEGHKPWSGKALRSCRRCLRCNLVALELATLVGTLVKAWLDDHQKELQWRERERGALEPPALHFDDLQF